MTIRLFDKFNKLILNINDSKILINYEIKNFNNIIYSCYNCF